jgi:hypothetical protein
MLSAKRQADLVAAIAAADPTQSCDQLYEAMYPAESRSPSPSEFVGCFQEAKRRLAAVVPPAKPSPEPTLSPSPSPQGAPSPPGPAAPEKRKRS